MVKVIRIKKIHSASTLLWGKGQNIKNTINRNKDMGNLGYGTFPTHPREVLKDEIEELADGKKRFIAA